MGEHRERIPDFERPSLTTGEREQRLPRRPGLWLAGYVILGVVLARLFADAASTIAGPLALVASGLGLLWLITRRIRKQPLVTTPWLSPLGILCAIAAVAASAWYAHSSFQPPNDSVILRYPDGAEWAVFEGVVREGTPYPLSDPAASEPDGLRAIGHNALITKPAYDTDAPDQLPLDEVSQPNESDPSPTLASQTPTDGEADVPSVFRQREAPSRAILLDTRHDLVTQQTSSGGIRVVLPETVPDNATWRAGDRVRVRGRLVPIPWSRNQGEPDLLSLSLDRDIHATLTLKSIAHLDNLGVSDEYPIRRAGESARAFIIYALAPHLAPDSLSLFACLALGDRSALSRSLRDQYVATGTIHILVVSGLHVMVLGLGVFLLASFLGAGIRLRAAIVAFASLAFFVLSGMGVPALRATTIVVFFAVAKATGRKGDFLNLLGVSAILVLLRSPADLFTAGFQLSYLCVLALALLAPSFSRKHPPHGFLRKAALVPGRIGRWTLAGLAGGVAVTVITTPLVLRNWFILAPATIVLSVAAMPLLFLILLLGLLVPAVAWADAVLAPVAWALDYLLSALNGMVAWTADLPGSHWYLPPFPDWWLIAFYLIVACVFLARRLARVRTLTLALLLTHIGIAALLTHPAAADRTPRIHFLDVHQGACAVIEADGRVIVADCGSQMRPHVGEWTIVPFLLSRGHRDIDALLLTHVDADHINGAISICERLRVHELWISPEFEDAPQGPDVLRALQSRVHTVRRLQARQRGRLGTIAIDVLWPKPEFVRVARSQTTRTNAASLVVRIECGGMAALLTGDAEDTATIGMAGVLEPSDILQAPHHGSAYMNLPTLLQLTTPSHVVVSARSTFAQPETLAALADGRALWTTFADGCISFESSPDGKISVRTRRGELGR